jgi:hypothetical protein
VQLTLNTSDVFEYGQKVASVGLPALRTKTLAPILAGLFLPFGMLCGLSGGFRRRSSLRLRQLLMICALTGLALGLQACTGKLPGETPPGTYTVLLTGKDAGSQTSITQTITLELTVTPAH